MFQLRQSKILFVSYQAAVSYFKKVMSKAVIMVEMFILNTYNLQAAVI